MNSLMAAEAITEVGRVSFNIPLPQVKLMWNLQFKPCTSVCCSNLEFFLLQSQIWLEVQTHRLCWRRCWWVMRVMMKKRTYFKNVCISCLILTNLASAALQYAVCSLGVGTVAGCLHHCIAPLGHSWNCEVLRICQHSGEWWKYTVDRSGLAAVWERWFVSITHEFPFWPLDYIWVCFGCWTWSLFQAAYLRFGDRVAGNVLLDFSPTTSCAVVHKSRSTLIEKNKKNSRFWKDST